MPLRWNLVRPSPILSGLLLSLTILPVWPVLAQDAPSPLQTPPASQEPVTPPPAQASAPPPQELAAPIVREDKSIFEKPVPQDQLTFLSQFAGAKSKDLYRDKQFHKLLHNVIPGCIFHYGIDMSLPDALELTLESSTVPVEIHDGRYVVLAGTADKYPGLQGRGMVWIDMQEGIVLGAFYFHPVNGEPTPSVTVFSKQVRQDALSMGQLPMAFAIDLGRWAWQFRIPPLTTRYFIGAISKKILLEHDEDYCRPRNGTAPPPDDSCQQFNADAADLDLTAASYLDATHHATNATAWMMSGEDTAWLQVRASACGVGPDPLGCRIRMTRERIHVVVGRRR